MIKRIFADFFHLNQVTAVCTGEFWATLLSKQHFILDKADIGELTHFVQNDLFFENIEVLE